MPQLGPLPVTTLQTNGAGPLGVITTRGPNQVPYIELLEYSESFQENNPTAVRTCVCLWEQRHLFKADMLGTSKYVPGNGVGGVATGILRLPPEAHPELPFLFASQCDLSEPMGVPTEIRDDLAKALTSSPQYGELDQIGPSNMVAFNLAKYQVTYTFRDWDVLGDADVPSNNNGELNRYVSKYYEPAAENQPYPGGSFKFVSDNTIINEPPAKTIPTLELQYVWRQVPGVPDAAIEASIGTCNLYPFDNIYPPETLICHPPKRKRYITANGDVVYDLTFIFTYRRATWNALFRASVGGKSGMGGPDPPGSPGFDRIIGNDGVTLATPKSDFNALFVLP
jgi:hypothetical protein